MHITKQMARFLFVGIFTNIGLYLVYLYITFQGIDHKHAMSIVYIAGVIMGFILNRKWTFKHRGHISKVFMRYLLLYFFGYFVNLGGLFMLVDMYGYPHQFVQLGLAILMAFMFFILQRIWIFPKSEPPLASII